MATGRITKIIPQQKRSVRSIDLVGGGAIDIKTDSSGRVTTTIVGGGGRSVFEVNKIAEDLRRREQAKQAEIKRQEEIRKLEELERQKNLAKQKEQEKIKLAIIQQKRKLSATNRLYPGTSITPNPKAPFYTPLNRRIISSGTSENIGRYGSYPINQNSSNKSIKENLKDVTRNATISGKGNKFPEEALNYPVKDVQPIYRNPNEKGILNDLSNKINEATGKKITGKLRGGKSSVINELKIAGLGVARAITNNVIGFRDLPKNLKILATNPQLALKIPGLALQSIRNFGDLIFISPSYAIGVIGGELVVLKGTSMVFRQIKRLGSIASARLSPKYAGKARVGSILNITTKSGKRVKIKVVGRIGSKGLPRESIGKQLKLAGKNIKLATSTQADELVRFIRRNKIIRKPIPGEEKFSTLTKKLLKRFDEGNISSKNLIKLDRLIKKQSGKGLLERSFFADPRGRVRPSRLGINDKEAGLLEALYGDVSFRTNKPQILVFENVRVQKFPKNLRRIANKLKKGQVLTRAESEQFLKFQLKRTGKFKPLGFASGESEITLAPGEIIKRVKKIGVTLVKGKKVNIVQVKVIRPTGKLKSLLTKYKRGLKLTAKEQRELRKLFRKQTGTKISLSSSKVSSRVYPIKRIGLSSSLVGLSKIKLSKASGINKRTSLKSRASKSRRSVSGNSGNVSRGNSSKRKGRSVKSPRSSVSGSKSAISPRKSRGSSGGSRGGYSRSPIKSGKKKKILGLGKGFIKKTLAKQQPTYFIKIKRNGKIVNLNQRPLTLQDAKDYLAYKIDNNIIRSGWFEPYGKHKVVVKIPRHIKGYFSKNSRKLRPYKIRNKRKKQIYQGYIEKNRYILDKKRERLQLRQAQRKGKIISPKRKRVTKKSKRNITPAQRKILIKRLAKARKVRLKNLKKRK